MTLPALMPHQKTALDRLLKSHGRHILALPCGAGKTLVTLSYLFNVLEYGRFLVVCPKSLLGTWTKESEKWFKRKPVCITGIQKDRDWHYERVREDKNGFYVVGYETFQRDYKRLPFLREITWEALVADESSKIKNPTTMISKIMRVVKRKCCILLNATLIENSIGDLWAQAEMVEPGVLYGNFYRFRALHAVMNQYFPGIKYWRDKQEIINKVKHLIFSVPKEEVTKNLPPLTESVIEVELEPSQQKVYDRIRDEFLLEIDNETTTVANALVKLTRLRQCTDGLWSFGDNKEKSAKEIALRELLEQFGSEKSLIFTQFAETAKELSLRLGIKHIITGAEMKRDLVLSSWEDNGTALIGTLAIAKGLNLQKARYAVFIDLPWTYALYEQIVGRVWRTGQNNPVTAYIIEARDTVDEKIRKLVWTKKADGDLLTNMTKNDIKNLIL